MVRDRAWILPEFLDHLAALDWPPDRLHYFFLVNDCTDNSEEILDDWMGRKGREGTIAVWNRQIATDARWNLARRKELYGSLADLRNRVLDYARSLGPDWFLLSLDSDILVPPDLLRRLMSHGVDAVSATISNALPGSGDRLSTVNSSSTGEITPDNLYIQAQSRRPGMYEVVWTGAVFLLSPSVLASGAAYANSPVGEDKPFCDCLRRKGIRMYQDGDCIAEHILNEIDLQAHREGKYWDDAYVASLWERIRNEALAAIVFACCVCAQKPPRLEEGGILHCPLEPPFKKCGLRKLFFATFGGSSGRAIISVEEAMKYPRQRH